MILTPLQKLPNNVGDLGKIIVATGFEWLPKVQKISQSGHTVTMKHYAGTTIVTYYITQRKLVAISCSQTSGHLFRISGVNLSSNLVQWNGATTMSTYPPIPLDFMIFQIYQKFKIIGESCF